MGQSTDSLMAEFRAVMQALDDHPDLKARLSLVGCTGDRIQQGQELFDRATESLRAQNEQFGKQYAATDRFNTLYDDSKAILAQHLFIARATFEGNVDIWQRLGLTGRRERKFINWYAQAEQFYTTLLRSETIIEQLQPFGVSRMQLEAAYTRLIAVERAYNTQNMVTSESQRVTDLRDSAILDLQRWLATFRQMARIAFADKPENLHTFGYTVSPRTRARISVTNIV